MTRLEEIKARVQDPGYTHGSKGDIRWLVGRVEKFRYASRRVLGLCEHGGSVSTALEDLDAALKELEQ